MSARESRPAGAASESPAKVTETSVPTFDDTWAVLVSTLRGANRRAPFLSLHSAFQAVERAKTKRQEAHMVLWRVVPRGEGW